MNVLFWRVVLVLGLCSWCCSQKTRGSNWIPQEAETWAKTVLTNVIPPNAVTAQECPGAVGKSCTRQCQLRTCQALAEIYRVSNNASDPWDHEHGWEDTTMRPCKDLVANISQGEPAYCDWHGVSCCDEEDMAQQRCYLLHSVSALNLGINNLNVSLENPQFFGPLKTLHDCGLLVLDLENNNIIGTLSEGWGQLRHLRHLNLGTGWLHGRIPEGLRAMRNLTHLQLSNNWFSGPLPQWLPDLKFLRVLNLGSQFGDNKGTNLTGLLGHIPARIGQLYNLRELILESNSLSGRLPDGLCHADAGSLLVFNVRGNQLEGSAKEVEDCEDLVQLDISHNKFTGSLPASTKWEQLATYTASHNSFTGRWPRGLYEARILEYLDLSNNGITGLIPPKVTLMSSLKSVKLSNNKFSGTVVEDLYYMPAIAVLDLSNNQFVGTTPVAIGLTYSLTELDLSNNSGITGMMPPVMGLLPRLQLVKLTQTNMSCAGIIRPYTVTTNQSCSDPDMCTTPQEFGDPSAPITRCAKDALLPCFLRFTDYSVPREDNSNMKCKVIMRKPTQQAQEDCAGTGPQQLAGQAASVPNITTDRFVARCDIDPAYYQYQACECLLGFTQSWDSTGTVLTCVPEQKSSQLKSIIIAVVVAAAAVLAVALLVWRQYLRTRPRWLRERLLQGKRSKGAPKASKPGDRVLVSVLVTDVKDFSELTRQYPELMNKAMGGHNNIMRKACHAHAGHVMDQEGDSWTVAFHDAEDAVAFSLQVQQALGDKVWGFRPMPSSDGSLRPLVNFLSTAASEASATSSYGMMGSGGATPVPPAAGGRGGLLLPHSLAPGRLHSSFSGSFSGSEGRASSLGRANSAGQSSQECSFTSARAAQQGAAARADIELGLLPAAHAPDGCRDSHLHGVAGGGSGLQHGSAGAAGQQRKDWHHMLGGMRGRASDDTLGARDAPQHLRGLAARSVGLQSSFAAGRAALGAPPAAATRLPGPQSPPDSRVSHTSGSGSTNRSIPRAASRLYTAGSALMQRFSRAVRSNMNSGLLQPLSGAETHGHQEIRLSVRIGIGTGWLQYGSTLDNCAIKERAKHFISDVANGGQVLMDERTFRLVKHSLSALGTVDENGYNDKQLQQLMHARVVAKIQRHVACGTGCASFGGGRRGSFSSGTSEDTSRDYDTDAIVLHMGGFTAPLARASTVGPDGKLQPLTTTSDDSTPSAEDDSGEDHPPPALAAAAGADKPGVRGRRGRRASMEGRGRSMHLQLYSIAAPRMRRLPQHTQELQSCTAWCQHVVMKPGWMQVQKDYFQAPGARPEDLCPSSQQDPLNCRAPLPRVAFVFAEVLGAHSFNHKHHGAELHALNKAIRRCMLHLMAELPGGDGYMCRCHEPDLRYMVAFESPVRAVQWCLLLQEALMYVDWPESILCLPGFEEVVDQQGSGQLLFRGPRLRMGVSEGVPSSILPDHMGRANYTGGAVNRAARFMDAAAQGGQVVCDLQFAQRCFEAWAHSGPGGPVSGRQSWGSGLDAVSPESIPESAAATDWGDPQISLMQLMALRSQSETSGHCRPATGPQGLRSRALHELWYQQQQLKQEQKELHRKQARQQQQQYAAHEQAASRAKPDAAGSSSARHAGGGPAQRSGAGGSSSSSRALGSGGYIGHGSGASFTRHGAQPSGGSFTRYNPLVVGSSGAPAGMQGLAAPSPASTSVFEPVTANFIGNFSFKGSGVFEMVQLQLEVLAARQFPLEPPKGKGVQLSVTSGPVTVLPLVQLHIPARVLAARQAWVMRAYGQGGTE